MVRAWLVFRGGLFLRDFFELRHTFANDLGWKRKTQTLSRDTLWSESHLGRTDAHQTCGKIDHWSATVAWINGRVGLDQVLVFNVVDRDVAFGRAEDAATNRAAVTDCVSDDNYGFTEQIRRNVVEANEWEVGVGVDLDEGEVLLVVPGDIMRVVGFAVVRGDLDFQVCRALDHVLVSNDVPGRIDNEA